MLVEDHPIMRVGLRNLLEGSGRIQVVASVDSAEAALTAVGHTACDIALVDLSLPGQDGLWLMRQLKERQPALPVLILSMHQDAHYVVKAMTEGASGYLSKATDPQELLRAVDAVATGGSYVQPKIAPLLIQALQRKTHPENRGGLTERELGILRLVAEGKPNRVIAKELSLSISTVKSHLRVCFEKFQVDSRTELVVEALKSGLIRPTD